MSLAEFTGLVVHGQEAVPLDPNISGLLIALTALIWTIVQEIRSRKLEKLTKKEARISPEIKKGYIRRSTHFDEKGRLLE